MVAGGDEARDIRCGITLAGAGDVGVDSAHLAGERSPDRAGVGVGGHPEPRGCVHDPVIMARAAHVTCPRASGGPLRSGSSRFAGLPTKATPRARRGTPGTSLKFSGLAARLLGYAGI